MNNYFNNNLLNRLQKTAETYHPYDCNIKTASSISDRNKRDTYMLQKLQDIHGEVPYKSDWRVWTICGVNARKRNSKDYDINPDHYFIYDHTSDDEREQLRNLYIDGHILTLPTGQYRLVNMKKNGTFNMDKKVSCKACGQEVTATTLSKHISSCDVYTKMENKMKVHTIALQGNNTSKKFIKSYIERSVKQYFDTQFNEFNNKKETQELYKTFINEVLSVLGQSDYLTELNNQLTEEIKNKTELNKNLSQRIKNYENKITQLIELTQGIAG